MRLSIQMPHVQPSCHNPLPPALPGINVRLPKPYSMKTPGSAGKKKKKKNYAHKPDWLL